MRPPVTLESLLQGGAAEKFAAALEEAVGNILDPNTKADATREVVLKVTIKPNLARTAGEVSVSCSSKTQPPAATETRFIFGKQAGRPFAVEDYAEQSDMFPATTITLTPAPKAAQGE